MRAPDNNPDVKPKGLMLEGGVWATLGSIAGLAPLILGMLPPDKYPWVPAASAFVGWLLKYIFVPPSYIPDPTRKEP